MATKTKAAKPSGFFSKLEFSVPILAKNAGKPASKRKANAEKEFRKIVFPTLRNHELWDITSIKWRGPIKPKMKQYRVTVGLKRNKTEGPPSDSTVTKPTTPPPSA